MRIALTLSLIIALFLGQPQALQAAPSNGTRFPPAKEVELGYEYDMMFKRVLNRSYGDLKNENHFYTASFGVFDWLSLDGKIGIGDARLRDSSRLPALDLNTGFSGGYGFRIMAFEHKKIGARLIVGCQHISVHPQDRSAGDDKYESFIDDWQVSGLIAKDFKNFTAYTGIKGSDCEFVYKINKRDKKRRYSETHVGLITGLELYLFDNKLKAAVEGRFFDETALSASVSYLFW